MTEDANPQGLSDDQYRALARALDEIIPARDDGRLPGAGELGVGRSVEQALRGTPALYAMLLEALTALEELARRRHDRPFAAVSREAQSELLHALAYSEHAFPPVLLLHAYAGYYQDARVVQALGLEPRAPHPAGYAMPPNDLSLLDPVRRRPKRYREC